MMRVIWQIKYKEHQNNWEIIRLEAMDDATHKQVSG